jgi:polysaccharide export outer membrane protein
MAKAGRLQLFSGILVCILIMLGSCTPYKSIPYFSDFSDKDTVKPIFIKSPAFKSPVIEPEDILTITLETEDNAVKELLSSNSAETASSDQTVPNGYTVNRDGYVRLRFLGKIKVAGLTTTEASNLIEGEANKQFNNASVEVRFADFKVTVLGEVGHPSTFVMPNEKVNIFDAIGLAGDITIYGKRESVLLLRDSINVEGKKAIRLNLNSKNIVSSPYFFLQPNDVLYVPPSKVKVDQSNGRLARNISIVASIISLIAIITYNL